MSNLSTKSFELTQSQFDQVKMKQKELVEYLNFCQKNNKALIDSIESAGAEDLHSIDLMDVEATVIIEEF